MRAELPKMSLTRNIPKPNAYIKALEGEFRDYAYNEERAVEFKGCWREKAFGQTDARPLDLEIGTGNGYHFAHYAKSNPERLLLGIELKYKPLIQSIRRALANDSSNARIMRFNARYPDYLFAKNELDNVIIHFPDPWIKKKVRRKNRLIQPEFMQTLFQLQKSGSTVEFKTDNRDYFDCALEVFADSPYQVVDKTFDLHKSEYAEKNFITTFEEIFMRQGLPIHFALLKKT